MTMRHNIQKFIKVNRVVFGRFETDNSSVKKYIPCSSVFHVVQKIKNYEYHLPSIASAEAIFLVKNEGMLIMMIRK